MAAITKLSRFQGVNAITRPYAATDTLVLSKSNAIVDNHICYGQLTGAMTINVTPGALSQFDVVYFHFSSDSSDRVVTFGTGFVASGTLTVTASKDATAVGIYDGTNIKIYSREVGA